MSTSQRKYRLIRAGMVALAALLAAGLFTAVPVVAQETQPPPPSTYDLGEQPPQKETTAPVLGQAVYDLYENWADSPDQAASDAAESGLDLSGDQVKVMITTADLTSADAAAEAVANLGGEVTARYKTWMDAWVPVVFLEKLSKLSGVRFIDKPIEVLPVDAAEPSAAGEVTQAIRSAALIQQSEDPNRPGAPPVFSEEDGALGAAFDSISYADCVISVQFTVTDAGTYYFEVWDDGVRQYRDAFPASTGQTINTDYVVYRPINLGVGLYVVDGEGSNLAADDPYYPGDTSTCGLNVTQGLAAANGDAWQNEGYFGSGVKIGILDSFSDYPTAQSLGELPATINTLGTLDLSSRHGTAVAEVIFDFAPAAEYTFASPATAVEMADQIVSLSQSGHQIISSSMGFYLTEPGDGTGPVSDAVTQAYANGTLYVQAGGNQRNYHYDQTFVDADGDHYMEFSGSSEINQLGGYLTGGTLQLYMRWNAWPTTDQDYDFFLYRWDTGSSTWVGVAQSQNWQSGTQPPVEWISYNIPLDDTGPGYYGIAVYKYFGNGGHVIDLMGHNAPSFQYNVEDRSLIDPATGPYAFSTAALDVASPYDLEGYSSFGPTHGAGGSTAPGLAKPRISGYANVDTWAYGPGVFNGTSSATPHAAGAAALLLSRYSYLPPGDLMTNLEALAVDMGSAGYDYSYGAGRLSLGPAYNTDTTGVFRPSNGWIYLKNMNLTGFADQFQIYGVANDLPVAGDWDGDGVDSIGVFRDATFYLRNDPGACTVNCFADTVIPFGEVGDWPVAGDWDGDGIDEVGVYRDGTFYLVRSDTDASDLYDPFGLGIPGDLPIAGDWDGDNDDSVGVFRPSNGWIYLKMENTTGFADQFQIYGIADDWPLAGDWDGDGVDSIGVYRGATFYLRNDPSACEVNCFADIIYQLGIPGDLPIGGNWDGLPVP